MKKTLCLVFVILTAVLGSSVVTAAPAVPEQEWHATHLYLPQTKGWFEETTGLIIYGGRPPAFPDVLKELDTYWDDQATSSCTEMGCLPPFGGYFTKGACQQVLFHKGDILWGGWYERYNLPPGMEALRLDDSGWVGVYRVYVDEFRIPETAECQGGRFLREVQYMFAPLIVGQ